MRNFSKVILTFVFLIAAAAAIPVVSEAAGTPSGLRQNDANRTGVIVSWDAVPEADAYYVQISSDGLNWETKADATTPSKVITGLGSGATYYVRVASYDKNGTEIITNDDIVSEYSAPIEVVTAPDAVNITSFNCTNVTKDSQTFAWNACPGATGYFIYDLSNEQFIATTADTTYTRTGLMPGSKYGIKIMPVRTSAATGYTAHGNSYYMSNVKTAPISPNAADFSVIAENSSVTSVSFIARDSAGHADGYEVEAVKVKGKVNGKMLSALDARQTNGMAISRNVPYKYRVRYYVKVGPQSYYGEWSAYRYFLVHKASGTSGGGKIRMNWSKVAGATGYTVYASTKQDGKYTKVKSLGKKSRSITITKIGKKKVKSNKVYFVRVVPKIKDGKKTITNDAQITYKMNKSS